MNSERKAQSTAEITLFWQPLSLEDLAGRQSVSGTRAPDETGALWPVDNDADAPLQQFLGERVARPTAAQGGGA